jgi:NADPH2:quinone reductase
MKAIQIEENGGPEVMKLVELPIPEPGEGQVRIRQGAIGVNFIDIYHRNGLYPVKLPHVIGEEGAGTVDAVGRGVSGLREGDRVAYSSIPGGYAEYTLLPAERAVKLPPGLSDRQGAAAMLQGMTAHYLAVDTYPIQRGDTVLVHAGAGGVGQLLVQVAKKRGARVLATVSTREKAERARAAGADQVILYTEEDFEEAVRRLTAGAGVQAVYDSVGKTTFRKSLACLARRGMLVLFGQSSGPVEPVDPALLVRRGSLYLTRPSLVDYVPDRDSLQRRAGEVLGWVADGSLRLEIGRVLPLAQAAEAHRLLAGRRTVGKLLLEP